MGVAVVHVDLRANPGHEAEAHAWLNEGERAAWNRYLPGPRRRFALCRAALRAVLCSRLDCGNGQLSFGLSGHGKPFAMVEGVPSPVAFNVSHSGDHGLLAMGPVRVGQVGRVGVDVEERVSRKSLDSLIEEVMGPDELSELSGLRGSEKLRLFYRLWTLKEALIKALGTGLSTPPSRFQVPGAMRRGSSEGTFTFPDLPEIEWGLREIGTDLYAAALACEIVE